jgi:hypothetical protein
MKRYLARCADAGGYVHLQICLDRRTKGPGRYSEEQHVFP